jgi:hypothetical protein
VELIIFLYKGFQVFFPLVKWPRPAADHSYLSCAEVKNDGAITLHPQYMTMA